MTIFICSSAVAASQADHLDRAIPFVDIRAQRACSAARGLTLIVKITPISVRPGITDALITMSNEGGTGCFGRMGQQQILMVRTSGQKWIKMLDVKSDAVTPDPSELHA